MLTLTNNSDTLIVVLHEIYGINDHIKKVSEDFFHSDYDVVCPDLLDLDEPFSYESEVEAYRYFMSHIGFDYASEHVSDLLTQMRDKYKRVVLVGYSIGATTGWLCCNKPCCDGFIGFYGSRIRDNLNVIPQMPVLLLYPEKENSFDTEELTNKLIDKENVKVSILKGRHGFADPFSQNYNELSYNEAKRIVKDFLACIL